MTIVVERQPIPRSVAVSRAVFNSRRAVQLLIVVVLLAVWEIVGRRVGAVFLPAPTLVFRAGVDLIESGELVRATLDSLTSLLVGYGKPAWPC